MKRLIVVAIVVLLFWPGCSELGEDPFPAPGPLFEADGSVKRVVLFKNGSVYNFDYTAQYDGISLDVFNEPTKLANGDVIPGGPWSSMSSKVDGGGAPVMQMVDGKNVGGIYKTKGINVFEFNHHERHNYAETWMFTLFDDVNLVGNTWMTISFWAKFSGESPDDGSPANPIIGVYADSSSGFSYGSGSKTMSRAEMDEEWHYYTVDLTPNPNIPATDQVRVWGLSAGTNAGRVFVDEIIIIKR